MFPRLVMLLTRESLGIDHSFNSAKIQTLGIALKLN